MFQILIDLQRVLWELARYTDLLRATVSQSFQNEDETDQNISCGGLKKRLFRRLVVVFHLFHASRRAIQRLENHR